MKKLGFLLGVLLVGCTQMFGQGARNIKINEVLTNNTANLQDEFGKKEAWIEIANTSYSTYNVRGMYITTDRRVLNKNLTVPQRIAMMSIIPNGDEQTLMSARKHLVFFLNSNPSNGTLHLNAKVAPSKETWVALYDGNAIDIIDSVTVPALAPNVSLAREKDGAAEWVLRKPEHVTPNISNVVETVETKASKLKHDDPNGIGITLLSMGVVFFCLSLLYVFFRLLGIFMSHKQAIKKAGNMQPIKAAVKTGEVLAETGHKTKVILKDGLQTGGIDKETYIAVISMALKQYEDDVHDVESNVITIKPHHTNWTLPKDEPVIP